MDSVTKPTPNRVIDAVAGKRCPICLNQVELRSAAAIIPCMHAYCSWCIRKWSDVKRKCPLCNADFTSWFYRIESDSCREEKLPPLDRGKNVISVRRDLELRRRRAQLFEQRSLISSTSASVSRFRACALPRRRSFRAAVDENPDDVAERVRQWRASIYEQRLRAVPLPRNTRSKILGNAREILLRRIEPWIRRELQAVLKDPDPTIIVHVASSIFISHYEKRHEDVQRQIGSEDDFLAPLRPFLQEQTKMFWHELRCFAKSTLTMETYDTVVEYTRID